MRKLAFAWILCAIVIAWPLAIAQVSGPTPGVSTNCGESGISATGTCLSGVGGGGTSTGTATATAYSGPGDVVSGATFFVGLMAYNAAYTSRVANICKPADASCLDVTVNGTTLNAATLTTLGCNNTSTICTVKTLYDQSGATNCTAAACNVTQATIANRPTLVMPGAANGCSTTTLPCLHFDFTASQELDSAAGLSSVSQPYSMVAAAVDAVGSAGTFSVIGAQLGSGTTFGFNPGVNTAFEFCGGVPVPTAISTDTTWHALSYVCNGITSAINVDGTNTPTVAGTDASSGTVVFGTDGFSNFLDGKAVFLAMYGAALTPTQMSSLSSNVHTNLGF